MRKLLLTFATIVAIISGCKKSFEPVKSSPSETKETIAAKPSCPSPVMDGVGRELPPGAFADLRVNGSTVSTLDDGTKVYKIPFFSKDSTTDFVVVATDSHGNYLNGKLINIAASNDWRTEGVFSGTVTVSPLGGGRPITQTITNGKPDDPNLFQGRALLVIVVVPHISLAEWFEIIDVLGLGNGIPHPSYIPLQGGGGGGSTPPPPQCQNPGPEVVAVPVDDEIIFDYNNSGPRVDLQKMFNCFSSVPDAGATYSVKLCADIPVNGNPFWVENNLSPGHAFLTITKTNGSQTVTQSFGFYPRSGFLSVFAAPVPSKIVDDGQHEYNAAIVMSMTQTDFNAIKNLALYYANNMQYDLNDFNCADFALGCFNTVRPSDLDVPNTIRSFVDYGTTPNGIYEKLKDLKDNNDPEAPNIQIGVFNGPTSHGECP